MTYKKKARQLIQKSVSRPDAIRTQLSNLSWEWGLANFFVQKVPNSFTTGRLFASGVVEFIRYLSKHLGPNQPIFCAELGAGTGILSKNVLDLLKDQAPKVYQSTLLSISDASATGIDDIQQRGYFVPHRDHAHIATMDALNPSFKQRPHFIYLSYLIDSLDTHHIDYRRPRLSEIKVRSYLPETFRCLDYRTFPPRVISSTTVKELIDLKDTETLKKISPQLAPAVIEATRVVPIEKTSIATDHQQLLQEFFSEHADIAHIRFNYSLHLYQWLNSLYSQLAESGLILIADFGRVNPNFLPKFSTLQAAYGATLFFTVFFPIIVFLAEKCGFSCHLTDNNDGETQSLLLNKNLPDQEINQLFQKVFHRVRCQNTTDTIKKIWAIKDTVTDPTILKNRIDQLLQPLSELEVNDSCLMNQIAEKMLKNQCVEHASYFAKKAHDLAPDIDIASLLAMAKAARLKQNGPEALSHLNQVLTIAPNLPQAHFELAYVYIDENRYDKAIEALKIYLSESCSHQWEHWIALALGSLEAGKKKDAITIARLIREWSKKHPFWIPNPIAEKAILVEKIANKKFRSH